MYRSFLMASALAATTFANAQQIVHQVLVLNEGNFDFNTQTQVAPVTLGSYDPATGVYITVATITDARFGNYVAVNNGVIYVSADDRLLKYDADTYTLLGEAEVQGIRRFAFWNDDIVITLGEVGGLPHYCEVRDKNTLELEYIIDAATLPYSCEGVEVVDDKAYIAVNNGFEWGNAVGKLGVLNLATQSWETAIDLGANGLNPENVMVVDGTVYTFNNKDFMGSSISRYNIGNSAVDYTNDVALSSGCGSSAPTADRIYFMEYAQNVLNTYDLESSVVVDTLEGSPATYGLIDDPINGVMYGTTTDFFSSGDLHVMDHDGNILSTVAVGVSPGKLALDIRMATAVEERSGISLALYPNPTEDIVTIRNNSLHMGDRISILDACGRTVAQTRAQANGSALLQVAQLANGLYTVHCADGTSTRFTKR